ncbi:hypothetical protein A4A49_34718 [Nicotiana attenuata]|uniref:Uncharacterized protein n=1 Tax=Nicotiana attenuata TaxID=49451 RepID=A0A314L727_NICAT|nr:hypothetical protein A4A49_34718 [Nicotiana attenuata]
MDFVAQIRSGEPLKSAFFTPSKTINKRNSRFERVSNRKKQLHKTYRSDTAGLKKKRRRKLDNSRKEIDGTLKYERSIDCRRRVAENREVAAEAKENCIKMLDPNSAF